MELPPRVNTLYPNRENIVNDGNTPLPIETAFFLEDAQKDKAKFNRYWFNYPAEWSTANKGESIIGVRSAQMIKRRRRIEFDVYIFKVLKSYFQIHGGKLEDPILTDELYNKFYQDDIKEEYAKEPRWKWIANFTVIDWISEEGDLRGFFDAVNTAMKSWIAIHGEYAKVFSQNDSFVVYRDIQTDGYYDKDGFHEIVFTRNNDLDDDSQQYINFFQITNWNDDFADVFNIGTGSFQNNPKKYKTWSKKLVFDNVWDRHPCKIYSSIGEQSLHNYIGDSDIKYSPIKYFKLNSMDQRFWIDFYSDTHYHRPILLPPKDSFVIEMQFLPYDKMFI